MSMRRKGSPGRGHAVGRLRKKVQRRKSEGTPTSKILRHPKTLYGIFIEEKWRSDWQAKEGGLDGLRTDRGERVEKVNGNKHC